MRRPDPLPDPQTDADTADDSLFGSIGALIDDGQTLLEAEVDYQRKRLSYGLARSKGIGGLVLLGLALLFLVPVALVVGLLLALTPLLTAWGAMGVVSAGLVIGAALSFLGAAAKFRKAKAVLLGGETP